MRKRMSVLMGCAVLAGCVPFFMGNGVGYAADKAPAPKVEAQKSPRAIIKTKFGEIELKFFPELAPKHVENFIKLAKEGFYNGTIFHRVIPGFMIQGGCPLGQGIGGPGYSFDDEIHPELTFGKPYLLAMANAGKRMGRGTNGSQFFITVEPTPWLQGKHTIFGEVADEASRGVVNAIAAVRTGAGDKPVEPVVIESVTID